MYAAQLGDPDLGFNPFTAVKKVAKKVAKGAAAAGKGVAKGAKTAGKGVAKGAAAAGKGVAKGAVAVGKIALIPEKALLKYVLNPALRFVLTPVRNAVNTIVSRRAKKLSWDKRKTLTPTPAETKEAKAWTRTKLRSKGPHGKLIYAIATLVGPNPEDFHGAFTFGQLGDPATLSLITASIPIALVIINAAANKLKGEGAPADPREKTPTPAEQAQAEVELQKLVAADEEVAKQAEAEAGISGGMPWWGWALIGLGTLSAAGAALNAMKSRREEVS